LSQQKEMAEEMAEDDILGTYKPMMNLSRPPTMTCSEAIVACGRGFGALYIEESLEEVGLFLESLVQSPGMREVLIRFRGKARGEDREAEANGKVAAIAMYTFDIRNVISGLQRSDTFFDKLNRSMRERSSEPGFLAFVYYLMNGLEELPSYQALGTLWRGVRLSDERRARLAGQYTVGRQVVWSGFTSASTDRAVSTDQFAGAGGVLFRIGILKDGQSRSRDISLLSVFSSEKEVLLLPNIKLMVTSELELDPASGVWNVQLQEMAQNQTLRF
jgi:hypothetical protein